MLSELVKLANHLDLIGATVEADHLDKIILAAEDVRLRELSENPKGAFADLEYLFDDIFRKGSDHPMVRKDLKALKQLAVESPSEAYDTWGEWAHNMSQRIEIMLPKLQDEIEEKESKSFDTDGDVKSLIDGTYTHAIELKSAYSAVLPLVNQILSGQPK